MEGTDSGVIPRDFQFSQSSLQDFQECPRRFRLKYVEHRAWPALVSEPALEHEQRMLQGSIFHRMVQQHQVGIPAARISEMLPPAGVFPGRGEDLRRWWENYLTANPIPAGGRRLVETLLSVPVTGRRLVARIDLLALLPGADPEGPLEKVVIVDWKTGGKRPERPRLAAAFQTRVYRYVLARAGAALKQGHAIRPEQIEMVYWFADEPDCCEVFPYSASQFEADDEDLRALIADICGRKEEGFWMGPPSQRCSYCVYRALCNRGGKAGQLDEYDEVEGGLSLEGLSLDQVEEIVY
ncbi:MAG TPA: PD-(D/E)XK nuclease family protein [Anaerolineaceae bacterium]|nr:PD-(D/E)XK nuclease family protein [Anaerolineaceae bacterium]